MIHRNLTEPLTPLITPDRKYIVVKERLWRAANPHLAEDVRQAWTSKLMASRRAVSAALRSGDQSALRAARDGVQEAKLALGERGPVWWTDGEKDFNRYLVKNTPYASWFAQLQNR